MSPDLPGPGGEEYADKARRRRVERPVPEFLRELDAEAEAYRRQSRRLRVAGWTVLAVALLLLVLPLLTVLSRA